MLIGRNYLIPLTPTLSLIGEREDYSKTIS
jgi:hypothetical protein